MERQFRIVAAVEQSKLNSCNLEQAEEPPNFEKAD